MKITVHISIEGGPAEDQDKTIEIKAQEIPPESALSIVVEGLREAIRKATRLNRDY